AQGDGRAGSPQLSGGGGSGAVPSAQWVVGLWLEACRTGLVSAECSTIGSSDLESPAGIIESAARSTVSTESGTAAWGGVAGPEIDAPGSRETAAIASAPASVQAGHPGGLTAAVPGATAVCSCSAPRTVSGASSASTGRLARRCLTRERSASGVCASPAHSPVASILHRPG